MKYKIIGFQYKSTRKKSGTFRAKRPRALCIVPLFPIPYTSTEYTESIDLDHLFELGELPEAQRQKNPKRFSVALLRILRAVGTTLAAAGVLLARCVRSLFTFKKRTPPRLALYSGVLCSTLITALLSVAVVLAGLFAPYLLPHDELIVPELSGKSYADIRVALDSDFELLVAYENSDSLPAGSIISQTPAPGLVRKVYSGRAKPTLTLRVSMGKSFYTVEDFSGMSCRSSLLALHNSGIAVKQTNVYSDTVEAGQVISTTPAVGARLYSGEVLTLKVSLGKEIKSVRVPDLYGLGESQAAALLSSRGLALGKITYKSSSVPAGKVTEQQYSPYTTLAEGSTVDITVSLGTVVQKQVPDLYGLTKEAAEKRLSDVGLVVGNIYPVKSGAPKGTVIAQTPIALTPITSATTSVDLYISQ